jgi:hypothetical protein
MASIQLLSVPMTRVRHADGHDRSGVKWIQNTSQPTQARQDQQKKNAKMNASEATKGTKPNEGVE